MMGSGTSRSMRPSACLAPTTDGLEMTWGNAEAIVAMTEKIGRREGFGDVLADGIRVAWENLGQIGTEYAIHVDGEEVPAHDPRFTPGLATTYLLTPTPGRHTQGGELLEPVGIDLPDKDKYEYTGWADTHRMLFELPDPGHPRAAYGGHWLGIRYG